MKLSFRLPGIVAAAVLGGSGHAAFGGVGNAYPARAQATASLPTLSAELQVGDVVFIRVPAKPFREVADATGSWTNHVGIVVDAAGVDPLIAESTFPFSRTGRLSRFVARSEGRRVAVSRLVAEPDAAQKAGIQRAARQRVGVFYDTGFDLHSPRQFCSRFVREVLQQATGVSVGQTETFAELLARRPGASLGFWRVWYFGRIPWSRVTVTPASLLASDALRPVFDGTALRLPAH